MSQRSRRRARQQQLIDETEKRMIEGPPTSRPADAPMPVARMIMDKQTWDDIVKFAGEDADQLIVDDPLKELE